MPLWQVDIAEGEIGTVILSANDFFLLMLSYTRFGSVCALCTWSCQKMTFSGNSYACTYSVYKGESLCVQGLLRDEAADNVVARCLAKRISNLLRPHV